MNAAMRIATCLVRGAILGTVVMVAAHAASANSADAATFARVGDSRITQQEFQLALAQAVRSRFYHGAAPEEQLETLRAEVGERLVNDVLLAREATTRGIRPDDAEVGRRIAALEDRYAGRSQWQAKLAEVMPRLRQQFEKESLVSRLESDVRASVVPSPEAVASYYAAHAEKFTEPEQVRASLILLKVDPSSPRATWETARAKAAELLGELRAGRDFRDLARASSGDDSAAQGGDLGYLHHGMLPEPAQQALDLLQPGTVSEPVTVLEGVALLRLEERKPARLQSFDEAKTSAAAFARREAADAAWAALIATLRRDHPPVFEDPGYPSSTRGRDTLAGPASQ